MPLVCRQAYGSSCNRCVRFVRSAQFSGKDLALGSVLTGRRQGTRGFKTVMLLMDICMHAGVQTALEDNAAVDATDDQGDTLLHIAAMNNNMPLVEVRPRPPQMHAPP